MLEAQIQLHTSNIVKDIVNLVHDNVINDITTSIENQCNEEKLASLSKPDVTDVLYQFVSLHMPRIIDVLNVKLLTINREIELYLPCFYFLPLLFLDPLEHKLLYFQRDF